MDTPCENERQAGAVIHKAKADFESAHVHEAALSFEFNSCDLCCVAAATGRTRRVESTHSPLLNVFACWRQPVAEAFKNLIVALTGEHQLSHDVSVFVPKDLLSRFVIVFFLWWSFVPSVGCRVAGAAGPSRRQSLATAHGENVR